MIRQTIGLVAILTLTGVSPVAANGFGNLLNLGSKLAPVVPKEIQPAVPKVLETATAANKAVETVSEANKDLTPEQEYTLGRAFGAQLLQTRKPLDDEKANLYLNILGQSLARFSDLPETYAGYHFQLLDSAEVNAFSAPGGLIFVNKGLVEMTKNEDELAAVLAHEIGHVSKRHGVKAVQKDRQTKAWVEVGADAASVLGSDQVKAAAGALKSSVSDLMSTIVDKGYSRDTEYEADDAAVSILRQAGYPPQALLDMIRDLNSIPNAGKGGFTKTHPAPDDRIAHLHKLVSEGSYQVSAVQNQRYHDALAGLK